MRPSSLCERYTLDVQHTAILHKHDSGYSKDRDHLRSGLTAPQG